MRYFVTGASGWIGSAVTDELVAAGHEVVGLARSEESAGRLRARGAAVHRGDLDDAVGLRAAAADADGVVHLGFKHDFSDMLGAWRTERAVLEALLAELAGTDRPLVIASGLALGLDRAVTEDDPNPAVGPDSPRGGGERLVLDHAAQGVRSVAVRFAPTVHGTNDPGFVAVLVGIARERGVAAYVGEGTHRWAAVHRSDAARLVRLAVERAPAGTVVHAAGEEGVATRDIAAAIGARLGLPTRSVDPEDADEHFGWIGRFFGAECSGTSVRTRELLGCQPTGPTLLEDLAAGAYA